MRARSGDVIHPQLWESGSGYETRVAVMSVIGGRAFAGKGLPCCVGLLERVGAFNAWPQNR